MGPNILRAPAENWFVFPDQSRAASVFAPKYKASTHYYDHYALQERRAAPGEKSPNANQVVAFHSIPRWRAYFETTKASSNQLIVIYFTATWCGSCRHMEPTLDELAAQYTDVKFVKIDVDELFNVAREFGVHAMPTFLFIKGGREVDKVVGVKKEELRMKVDQRRAN